MSKLKRTSVRTGLDRIRDGLWKDLKGFRLGLLSNQASLDSRLTPASTVISDLLPGRLKALFGPQHGYGGEDQDNMVETGHDRDAALQVPVFSLYADTRKPVSRMMDMIDMLIIDLQDVGTRVYTFASTMLNCLKAAAEKDRKVLVLDRPNPLGGEIVEGNLLRSEFYSFVGPYAFPMRHGLTMGEMARIFDQMFELGCDLEVIAMEGWRRNLLWPDTGLKWVMPSPNMPFTDTAGVYPGQVIWEGTNISEGRGTCRPFEIFGAPFMAPRAIMDALEPATIEGCMLQPYRFRPTFHKWGGELCRGFMIHVTDHHVFRPYVTSLSLLKATMEIHGGDFQ
ncbi:MAG: DUF1343 domain-containing protein, partial [Deltaproteobacteria bacterium]|nr:DUF1343 domain-containing protein [Deltaproteobacteria bacterium]